MFRVVGISRIGWMNKSKFCCFGLAKYDGTCIIQAVYDLSITGWLVIVEYGAAAMGRHVHCIDDVFEADRNPV